MTRSLDPEDVTVVRAAAGAGAAHDDSQGTADDNDSDDSGGLDLAARLAHQCSGPIDDTD